MTTETPRTALCQRLTEILGPDHASTLMTYLPTDHPAAKSDVRDLQSDVRDLKSELKSDIHELRLELKSDIHNLEQRLGQRMDGVEVRLNNHDLRFDSLQEAMRQQTRTFILATTGMMVTLSAVAFGAASLIYRERKARRRLSRLLVSGAREPLRPLDRVDPRSPCACRSRRRHWNWNRSTVRGRRSVLPANSC